MLMKEHPVTPDSHSVRRDFLIFISVPLLVIIVVAAILQGPSLFAKPKYDFIYSLCQSYDCGSAYTIGSAGAVILQQNDTLYGGSATPTLYYYSEANNSTRRISTDQANSYRLDTSNVSPDGYTLWQNNDSSGGLFWDNSGDGSWYLKHGAKKKQLNLVTNSAYGSDVQFLGWVQQ
jgi:hypothetical protein